jgi:hypothetical protein
VFDKTKVLITKKATEAEAETEIEAGSDGDIEDTYLEYTTWRKSGALFLSNVSKSPSS